MRFCEDRNFVHRQPLKELFEERTETVGLNTMVFLKEEFKHYNLIFDSDLFRPQDWESNLAIDFKIMKEIVLDTYNPYQFDVIPLEVLGNIYEQYLGYTIRLTDHQVKYELKPDVRKAGGVYYTPEYIVDYIVKNTVGKSLQELTPAKIKKLRILDPACGSGSFLIRAYEEMLNYYKQQKSKDYLNRRDRRDSRGNEEKQKKLDLKHEEAEPRLTIEEKSQILREHIFGVDIDEQAVEVTKLSLMLKMLEGEYGIIPGRAILPMLDKNIRCGNSLISGSPLGLKDLFGEDFYKTKPFDWKTEFRKIMIDEGGFDVVIGNPPYIKIQKLQEFQPREVNYLKDKYFSASSHSVDIYVIFIEKALNLLSKNGLMGFICPHKFFNSNYGANLRTMIAERKNIVKILNFGINQVFENATTYTSLLFLSKTPRHNFKYYEFKNEVPDLEKQIKKEIPYFKIDSQKIKPANWVFTASDIDDFLSKIKKDKPQLAEISTNIFQGPKAGADPVFILKLVSKAKERFRCFSSSLEKEFWIEEAILMPYVKGKNIRRYFIHRTDEYIIYPYDTNKVLLSEKDIEKSFPCAYEYLSEKINKNILLSREDGRFKKVWWSYSRPQNMKLLAAEKILTPFNAFRSSFAFDNIGDFVFSAGVSGAYGIILKDNIKINYKYLLGLLNSALLDKYLKSISTALRGGFYSYENKYIKQLPIHIVDFFNTSEKKRHDDLIALVDVMLDLNKKIQTAKGSQKDQIQRQINKTDKEIDEIVYKLYGITDEERGIIEG
jgi:type I restriction-modification system DNA methylase subunit